MKKIIFVIGLLTAAGLPTAAPLCAQNHHGRDHAGKRGFHRDSAITRVRLGLVPEDYGARPTRMSMRYSGDLLRLNFSEKVGNDGPRRRNRGAVSSRHAQNKANPAPAPQGALGLGSNYFAANGNNSVCGDGRS